MNNSLFREEKKYIDESRLMDVDYQVKTNELVKETLFLKQYSVLPQNEIHDSNLMDR